MWNIQFEEKLDHCLQYFIIICIVYFHAYLLLVDSALGESTWWKFNMQTQKLCIKKIP